MVTAGHVFLYPFVNAEMVEVQTGRVKGIVAGGRRGVDLALKGCVDRHKVLIRLSLRVIMSVKIKRVETAGWLRGDLVDKG